MAHLLEQRIIADTVRWLERAVIGLNLCPFARSPHAKARIRYVVSQAIEESELKDQLAQELLLLQSCDTEQTETTLLICPDVLNDFLDFNDFLSRADLMVRKTKLEGVIQIASFHPGYRFADVSEDDVSNCTNRSPYPILHLLREQSVQWAIQAVPNPDAIYQANIETLRQLGWKGWLALNVGPSADSSS